MIPFNLLLTCGSFGETIDGSTRSVGAFSSCVFFLCFLLLFFCVQLEWVYLHLLLVSGSNGQGSGVLYILLLFSCMSCIFFFFFSSAVGVFAVASRVWYAIRYDGDAPVCYGQEIARHIVLAFYCHIASVFCCDILQPQ